jgi:hypothetical protein
MPLIPNRKVSVGGLASAIVVVGWWVDSLLHGPVPPPEIVAATVFIVGTGLSYLIPEKEQA